jgi:hypothetical protein
MIAVQNDAWVIVSLTTKTVILALLIATEIKT